MHNTLGVLLIIQRTRIPAISISAVLELNDGWVEVIEVACIA